MAGELLPRRVLVAIDLNAQELLLIVPLVERVRVVETLVALEADELGPEHRRDHLRELGLSRPRRSFDEERLLEDEREVEHRLDARVGDVTGAREALANGLLGDLHVSRRTGR